MLRRLSERRRGKRHANRPIKRWLRLPVSRFRAKLSHSGMSLKRTVWNTRNCFSEATRSERRGTAKDAKDTNYTRRKSETRNPTSDPLRRRDSAARRRPKSEVRRKLRRGRRGISEIFREGREGNEGEPRKTCLRSFTKHRNLSTAADKGGLTHVAPAPASRLYASRNHVITFHISPQTLLGSRLKNSAIPLPVWTSAGFFGHTPGIDAPHLGQPPCAVMW